MTGDCDGQTDAYKTSSGGKPSMASLPMMLITDCGKPRNNYANFLRRAPPMRSAAEPSRMIEVGSGTGAKAEPAMSLESP